MRILLGLLAGIALVSTAAAQEIELASGLIPADLLEHANAVVRLSDIGILVASQHEMTITNKTVTTVVNEAGLSALNLSEYYSKNRKITNISAKIYDANGTQIKVIKRRDFLDHSVVDGFSVFNDDRVLYAVHTPLNYPFTVVFESEVETSNTAFIPNWSPVRRHFVSVEESRIHLACDAALGFQAKEVNFDPKYEIKKAGGGQSVGYSIRHIKAVKYEEMSPANLFSLKPNVLFRLEKFNLEGIDGQATDWKSFGKWYYDAILAGTDEIPLETQAKLAALVGDEKDPLSIARIVYQFVQNRTRYVSIQVGLGGFKPMPAKDVDRLGYGDCKALSNYTRALLQSLGVPSYYTILWAGDARMDLAKDFASEQGNHAILTLPTQHGLVWLECTSQSAPFGFQGTFTDGREVLVIKPDGGEIVKTRVLFNEENSQLTKGNYALDPAGNITGSLRLESKGNQYGHSYPRETYSAKDKEDYYKHYFGSIGNLKLEKISLKNDKEHITFTQDISLSAPSYASLTGNRMMFVVNAYNKTNDSPKRYRTRENPFEVGRGYYDEDEITIRLPEGFEIEALPDDRELSGKYGRYTVKIVRNADHSLVYKRTLLVKDGLYASDEYEAYRLFMEEVVRNDNAKVVLAKKA